MFQLYFIVFTHISILSYSFELIMHFEQLNKLRMPFGNVDDLIKSPVNYVQVKLKLELLAIVCFCHLII